MKKFLYIFSLFLIVASCDDQENVTYDNENGQTLTHFATTSATLPVPAEGSSFSLAVGVSTVSSVDRNILIEVDESSTALPAEYTISNLVIPAGTYNGTINIQGNFEAIPDLTTTQLVLNLIGIEGGGFSDSVRNQFTLSMFKQCASDLAGTYLVASTGASTDGGTGFPTVTDFPYTVTIDRVEGTELEYTISDGVAGVYIEWYSVYGYTFETEGNFIDVCQSLSGSWVDAFGSTIELTGVDNGDGTLTINWTNGFGDEATAIYTRQ